MAFNPYKQDMADSRELEDAIITLHEYMEGRARAYEVEDALNYLERRFGCAVSQGCTFLRQAMTIEEEETRQPYCYQGIQLIERYVLRNFSARIE